MSAQDKPPLKEIPDTLIGPSGTRYIKGKFLGKGGFARCFELKDPAGVIHAGKIVSKSLLQKKHQKDKMTQEIAIHRSLGHVNVVGFTNFFEDTDNVYILLELCKRRSLMELHKRRRAITEPEARYFTVQIVEGVSYLHRTGVIHRDLKLGNLFLNDEMQIKIGDFGLATKVEDPSERKKTLCGTPNYIAPEMLNKKGHSFEVDIWAIGCILYTLLVGKPPFETTSLKETYQKIRKNDYHTPSRVSSQARDLISELLAAEPNRRPTIDQIKGYEFFTSGFLPSRLPTSCLTMAPKFPSVNSLNSGAQLVAGAAAARRALSEVQAMDTNGGALSPKEQVRKDLAGQARPLGTLPENGPMRAPAASEGETGERGDTPADYYLRDLFNSLTDLISANPHEKLRSDTNQEDAEAPEASPIFWIGKWVDYSDKYGLGYQLCDDSVGVLFNDTTRLILDSAGEQLMYVEKEGQEFYYTIGTFPEELNKKVTLLKYFRNYMNEHLLKAGAHVAPKEGDELARLPCLRTWFRTKSAIILHLTNGTLQVNFFGDHCKLILCPLMQAVTFIDEKRNFKTYLMANIRSTGCTRDLYSRIRYARTMVERLLTQGSSSLRPGAQGSRVGAKLSTASTASSAKFSTASAGSGRSLQRQATGLPTPSNPGIEPMHAD